MKDQTQGGTRLEGLGFKVFDSNIRLITKDIRPFQALSPAGPSEVIHFQGVRIKKSLNRLFVAKGENVKILRTAVMNDRIKKSRFRALWPLPDDVLDVL